MESLGMASTNHRQPSYEIPQLPTGLGSANSISQAPLPPANDGAETHPHKLFSYAAKFDVGTVPIDPRARPYDPPEYSTQSGLGMNDMATGAMALTEQTSYSFSNQLAPPEWPPMAGFLASQAISNRTSPTPDSSPFSTPSRPPGSRLCSLNHPSIATPLISEPDDTLLQAPDSDSDKEEDATTTPTPSSRSGRVRPTRAFYPYGEVANVMRGKAPLTVYRTKPRTGRLDDLKKSTRRFKDTMHRLFNSAEKLSDETGCWMFLAAQLPNAQMPFLHWVSPTMEDEMPEIHLNRLRTLTQRCFDNLIAGRRQDLAVLSDEKRQLEQKLEEMHARMEEYARILHKQGITTGNLPSSSDSSG
ncbi:hypothetical protein AAF712_010293 [Marasmius tenuissimus]|uniref:Uncharacterized protein n=1 Tax=Marasmius tenuissimus TaxID=585030 RepID=A0ABR2ZQ29_9AGAR